MKRFLKISLLVFMAGSVAACSQDKPVRNDNPQLVASPDKVSLMLANAADRASVALETLAAVEQARSPDIAVAPITNAPAELKRAVTVNWVGPVEPVAKNWPTVPVIYSSLLVASRRYRLWFLLMLKTSLSLMSLEASACNWAHGRISRLMRDGVWSRFIMRHTPD